MSDNFLRQSSHKKQSHLINMLCRGSQVCHFYPLGMAVNQPKEVMAIFLCKIKMHSLPHPSRPSPWVQCCTRGCLPLCLTNFKFGHQMQFRATASIATIQGCYSCNSCNSLFLSDGGRIIPIPHKKHSWSTDNSCVRVKYGFSSSLDTG